MSKVVLDVPDISCEHCAQTIANTLQPQEGVKSVQVDVPSQKVRLEFDEQTISLAKVKELLAEEEYPVLATTSAD